MLKVRGEEKHLTHTQLITFMKLHHREWLDDYLHAKKDDVAAYQSLMRLCQRFTARHGLSQRIPCFSTERTADLINIRDKFAVDFWAKFKATAPRDIINVDETSIFYDMPPGKTLAVKGGSSKVDKSEKHSDRLTAVLSIRSNGKNEARSH
ncbi:hypothetical protein Ae201684P_015884 [Aphanomyces euteiches]|uniref:DDE-1 domain-containing protein n=1 Tax=Aphanomyces euteiches TaxID=100861 RepID=A0A6G0W8Z6_9STRA|nr:hypothetical protein Ae201684_017966 [Aphanomyces euteiches]KAH9073984.1 hypothetical protein Ae201684P_015884 [Aphanomyces euteiches]